MAISTLGPRLFRSNGPSQHVVVARTIAEIDDKKSASSSTAVRKGKESIARPALFVPERWNESKYNHKNGGA